MVDPRHADVTDEVARFVALLLRTFDPSRYTAIADGEEFDRELQRVEGAFAELKTLFHDCLVAGWSAEAEVALQQAARQLATEPRRLNRDPERRPR